MTYLSYLSPCSRKFPNLPSQTSSPRSGLPKLEITILASKNQDRDELGRAVSRKGLLQSSLVCSGVSLVFFATVIGRRAKEGVSAGDDFLLFVLCLFFGGLFGLLLGISHGLPVVPQAKLKVIVFMLS